MQRDDITYIPIKIVNIGNGPAISFKLELKSDNLIESAFLGVLAKGENIYFGIYVDYEYEIIKYLSDT